MDYEIIHQPEQKLFKTEVDGRTAFVQYRLIGDSLDIIHTIVPQPIEGRGIAAALVIKFIRELLSVLKLHLIPIFIQRL